MHFSLHLNTTLSSKAHEQEGMNFEKLFVYLTKTSRTR